ncbi:o-succinylbenzoate---CoA ligase [Thermostichus sp. MS-CIW-21]|jgi:o-succinylbenzoate---CoA ligase|uniref:2-succinylbenzoate--CoA ligase n=2 Tax=Synechococcus TaxID=1129 RepID=UPI000069488C|nr:MULTISPECIES: 2-succinylbenzoate--CoA ligase [unclassified Synechococcus]ABD00777.1 O-succinylbenzoate--CoA ligase [Synechococcus sp. JA-3-3Ab]PIK84523.1 O-succinylbenzoic acid--CoA ligase [Synechococcus sp. 65AY6A5]PIK91786.1 O-succinylbenzoic acid--CoA ligase [Synechococcus sp. 65AY6Li]PIK95488.1 O-succinylbenzoic acid--CoA ligase [Synechococcus sp. 60AY4M2]PIK97732.1 O-succinylbenzoic acid--CoA ligase [Synechococcus sp. 63AY4M1]
MFPNHNCSPALKECLAGLEEQLRPLADKAVPLLVADSDPLQVWAAVLACQHLGIPLFLANPHWGGREWGQALASLGSAWRWRRGQLQEGSASSHPPLQHWQQILPSADWPVIGIPTGGSGGQVKWAVHSWRTLSASARAHQQHFSVDCVHSYCVLPLYHVSGLMQAVRSWLSGGQWIVWDWKRQQQAEAWDPPLPGSFLSLVPTQLQRLLLNAQPGVLESLRQFRAILVGGGPTWPSLRQQARQLHLPLALTYGMTESASQVCTLLPEAFLQGSDSLGRPLPHATLEIRGEAGDPLPAQTAGHIHVWAESLALGYYPLAREADGLGKWQQRGFTPGDWGYLDSDGYLYWLGRADDLILTGGEKVMAAEVEGEIRASGWVEDVCVLGLPDGEWGQQVVAVAVPKAGIPALPVELERHLKQHLSQQLSPFKHPKQWLWCAGIPRNAQGKVSRQQLRQWAAQQLRLATPGS